MPLPGDALKPSDRADTLEISAQFKEPAVGDLLAGRYQLEAELGRGGFGVVFRARHVDTRRTVAVKVLLATHARSDPKAVERFRREAILSASLEYPNTVDVFDYGETDKGVFFLVMEYLRGEPLSEVIEREAPLSLHRVVHITRQILYALMEAHARDIVHRDIKPENIMIVPLMYDPNHVKVMDFGIAKMVSGGVQLTQAGQTFGTPRYMAAEQLQGVEATPSTDLYAVGLIIYEMLTGRPAIDSDNLAVTIARVINGPPIALKPELDVPPEFHHMVRKASARSAQERFTSAVEFLATLDAWMGLSAESLASMNPEAATNITERGRELARLDAPTQALGVSTAEALPAPPSLPQEPAPEPTFDPNQTSLVPTHAGAGQKPPATQIVEPRAPEDAAGPETTETVDSTPPRPPAAAAEPAGGLKTGCLVLAVIIILAQAAAIAVLALMLSGVIAR